MGLLWGGIVQLIRNRPPGKFSIINQFQKFCFAYLVYQHAPAKIQSLGNSSFNEDFIQEDKKIVLEVWTTILQ